jgi:hypothetical protein
MTNFFNGPSDLIALRGTFCKTFFILFNLETAVVNFVTGVSFGKERGSKMNKMGKVT